MSHFSDSFNFLPCNASLRLKHANASWHVVVMWKSASLGKGTTTTYGAAAILRRMTTLLTNDGYLRRCLPAARQPGRMGRNSNVVAARTAPNNVRRAASAWLRVGANTSYTGFKLGERAGVLAYPDPTRAERSRTPARISLPQRPPQVGGEVGEQMLPWGELLAGRQAQVLHHI